MDFKQVYVSSKSLNEFGISIKLGLNKIFEVKCIVMSADVNT